MKKDVIPAVREEKGDYLGTAHSSRGWGAGCYSVNSLGAVAFPGLTPSWEFAQESGGMKAASTNDGKFSVSVEASLSFPKRGKLSY